MKHPLPEGTVIMTNSTHFSALKPMEQVVITAHTDAGYFVRSVLTCESGFGTYNDFTAATDIDPRVTKVYDIIYEQLAK